MKGELKNNISPNEVFKFIESLWRKSLKGKITVLGWQDGDYFLELCNEDGGVKNNDFDLFKNLPLGKKFDLIENLKTEFFKYSSISFLGSVNGNYKFIFDVFVWVGNFQIVFNPYLEKAYFLKLNLVYKVFGVCAQPPWEQQL